MGYYINREDGKPFDKAIYLVTKHDAKVVSRNLAREYMDDPNFGVVCVKDNGVFEAAGFMFNKNEFDAFADPCDNRPTTWLVLKRETAELLSDYNV